MTLKGLRRWRMYDGVLVGDADRTLVGSIVHKLVVPMVYQLMMPMVCCEVVPQSSGHHLHRQPVGAQWGPADSSRP